VGRTAGAVGTGRSSSNVQLLTPCRPCRLQWGSQHCHAWLPAKCLTCKSFTEPSTATHACLHSTACGTAATPGSTRCSTQHGHGNACNKHLHLHPHLHPHLHGNARTHTCTRMLVHSFIHFTALQQAQRVPQMRRPRCYGVRIVSVQGEKTEESLAWQG